MMGTGKSPILRDSSDSLTPDNGVVSRVDETRSPKRLKSESHPGATPSPSEKSLRGGKTRGRDEVE